MRWKGTVNWWRVAGFIVGNLVINEPRVTIGLFLIMFFWDLKITFHPKN